MKLALLPLFSLVSSFLPSALTSAVPSNLEVSKNDPLGYSPWNGSSPGLTRRQSNPNCPYTPFTEFKNNCPKGTTLAIYIGPYYAFTLNSVHDNARQSYTTRFDFENHNSFYATINQGTYGGPAPSASANVNTFFFMERYWFIKPKGVTKIFPVSITPSEPQRDGFCVPIKCDSKSCISESDWPEGRVALDAERTSIEARQDNTPWPPPIYTCPGAAAFTVTYCPDGTL